MTEVELLYVVGSVGLKGVVAGTARRESRLMVASSVEVDCGEMSPVGMRKVVGDEGTTMPLASTG